jgi:hypothetical protein
MGLLASKGGKISAGEVRLMQVGASLEIAYQLAVLNEREAGKADAKTRWLEALHSLPKDAADGSQPASPEAK